MPDVSALAANVSAPNVLYITDYSALMRGPVTVYAV